MEEEKRNMKNEKKSNTFFVDDMYSWSRMSSFELKKKFVQKIVDFENNT
jgi:hypothetical protein